MGDKINSLDLRPLKKGGKKKLKRSAFDAARVSRLSNGWTTTPYNTDTEIKESLSILRARSRNLAFNNDYARRFLNLVKTNVIGHNGMTLQSQAAYPDGTMDDRANEIIESAYKTWCKKGNCTANRKQSFLSFLSLAITALPTDGEILIRKVPGFINDNRFALHQYDPDFLDVDLNHDLSNGNQIRMGVEVNKWMEPVNYHFLTAHPHDWAYGRRQGPKKYDVVSASQIIHFYIHERINQTRGIPWLATPAQRLYQLGGYEEAELVAARTSASKMGFYKTPSGDEFPDEDDDGTDDTENRAPVATAEPGTFEELPEDWDFVPWDPTHPTTAFDAFCKAILRGVASGLGVSYVALANDLTGVSYSSIRAGTLSDQDFWKMLQALFIAEVMADFYPQWLSMSLAAGAINLPVSKFEKFNVARWQPRGWPWVDPLKEETAAEKGIKNATTTPQEVVAGRGGDVFDNIKAIRRAKDAADNAQIKTPALHWWEDKQAKTAPGGNNAQANQ